MPSLSEEEQITVADELARYMEVEIKEEDLSLRVDHFWRKVFGGIDSSGDKFVVLYKMVKCQLHFVIPMQMLKDLSVSIGEC